MNAIGRHPQGVLRPGEILLWSTAKSASRPTTAHFRGESVCAMWTRWNTHTTVQADPDDVIHVLTCVDAIHEWSPVDFDLDDLAERRLHGGTQARVVGKLAGFGVGFDVEVLEANRQRLELLARGPV